MNADEMSQTGLERRYRRLLRCYPPSHRELHQEEMLGVLPPATTAWRPNILLPAVSAILWLGVALLGLAGWRRPATAFAFVQIASAC